MNFCCRSFGILERNFVLGGDITQTPIARTTLERGGHLRVGLEDYAGPRTPTNEELVAEVVELAAEVGRPVVKQREAAKILDLPDR